MEQAYIIHLNGLHIWLLSSIIVLIVFIYASDKVYIWKSINRLFVKIDQLWEHINNKP